MINSVDMTPVAANNDTELVIGTLAGNRDAFSQIVSRYQSLICSLAYSATGSLGQSEDLAQETFITAWKHLSHLRERHKLRAWLCGIARNRINNFLRREGREPIREAEQLETAAEAHAPGPLPAEQTISNEEQAILWRSLERIPQLYREPLVLFYREHQSVETVAQNLELTEEAVKQRLSRGRKMLQEEILSFVEGALERTNPGKFFTVAVLAAIPSLTISAKAATIGATAVKGGGAAKAASAMGVFSVILTPLLIIWGSYASYRMGMDEAQTDLERWHIRALFRRSLIVTLLLAAALVIPLHKACQGQTTYALLVSTLASLTFVLYFVVLLTFGLIAMPGRRRYLLEVLKKQYASEYPPSAYEYRSRLSLFGLPLLHVRLGDRFDVVRPPVKAWIAVGGSVSVGVIFASGGLAIAPISFGGVAIGLAPFGAIAIGGLVIGCCSIGAWATGALAIGWQVFGACAIGWDAASGGLAIAQHFATGGIAHALQANTALARQFIQSNWFFRFAQTAADHPLIMMLTWVVPVAIQGRVVKQARRREEQSASQS